MPITKQFVLAGDATFTVSLPDGDHRTFRVQHVDAKDRWPESWFAKLLTGPDNERDFTYIGKLNPNDGQVATTVKSKQFEGSHPLRLLNRILAKVWADDHKAYQNHGYDTCHEGRCGRCNHKLTTPESCERGIGPECWSLMQEASTPSDF